LTSYQRKLPKGPHQMPTRNPEIDAFIDKAITYEDDDCLIWPFSRLDNGYPQLSSGRFKKQYGTRIVSRAICQIANGPPPIPKHEAAHSIKCTSKLCINRKHLRWATRLENFSDDRRGEDHFCSKLTEEQILEIRKRYATGKYTQQRLADEYNIHQAQMWIIITFKLWAWVEEPCDAYLLFDTTRPRMKDLFAQENKT
jgi:hypothetical protein